MSESSTDHDEATDEETTGVEPADGAEQSEESESDENAPTPENRGGATDEDESDGDDDTEPDEGDEASESNREAAKWRRKLRETEAELETERDNLANARREILSASGLTIDLKHGTAKLSQTDDLVNIAGHSLDDFVAADGKLDRDGLNTALSAMYETRPGLFDVVDRRPKPNPAQGREAVISGPSFADAMDVNRGR